MFFGKEDKKVEIAGICNVKHVAIKIFDFKVKEIVNLFSDNVY